MRTSSFAGIEDLRQALAQDATMATRYPARFILVSGLTAWREVIDLLDELGARGVRLSTLTAGDAVPNMQSVVDTLGKLDSSIVIKPLGEILRLAPGAIEPYITWLTGLQVLGRARLYIPLLDVSAAVMPLLERMRQYLEYSPPVWRIESGDDVAIRVTSETYRCLAGQRFDGVKAYLQQWEAGGVESGVLVTGLANLVAGSHGNVWLDVLPTAYDVVSAVCADRDRLRRQYGRDGQWRWLANELRPDESVSAAAARILMVPRFEPAMLWERWPHLEVNHRWLAWLWAKCYLEGDGPAVEAVKDSESPERFVESAANIVFGQKRPSVGWLRERRRLLQQISRAGLPASFWRKLEQTNDPLMRLAALPGLLAKEQEAIVALAGQLVMLGAPTDQWLPILEVTYPDLHTYLSANPLSGWLGEYILEYKRARLTDRTTPRLTALAGEWADQQMLWRYEARAESLHLLGLGADDALWVDGLGLEWVGLIWRKLTDSGLQVHVDVARASLPSVTSENHEWSGAQVLRGMDGYAHSHEYAYPQSLVRQISVIEAITQEVRARLRSGPVVTLTSDHGMTRFAGAGEKVKAPQGYDVHGWGRYARKVAGAKTAADSEAWIIDGDALILTRHGLFSGGSATGGEVHGGATPEESLTPVLTISGAVVSAPTISASDHQVFLDVRGHGELHVTLTEPCASLYLQLPGGMLLGRQQASIGWVFALAGLRPGNYAADVFSERGAVGRVTFECLRGLAENDMGL